MIEFMTIIESRLLGLLQEAVGVGNPQVKKFDDHLEETEVSDMPLLVVTVRNGEPQEPTEMDVPNPNIAYTVHIYYLDIETKVYSEGKRRRDNILARVEKVIDNQWNLGNLDNTDSEGTREYVYDVGLTNIIRDSGGVVGAYSFTGEIYLEVFTARTEG